jgi:hypothetical protein
LYSHVSFADEVDVEFRAGQHEHPGSPDLSALNWLTVHKIDVDPSESMGLDAGEAATLALALSIDAQLVLPDK